MWWDQDKIVWKATFSDVDRKSSEMVLILSLPAVHLLLTSADEPSRVDTRGWRYGPRRRWPWNIGRSRSSIPHEGWRQSSNYSRGSVRGAKGTENETPLANVGIEVILLSSRLEMRVQGESWAHPGDQRYYKNLSCCCDSRSYCWVTG